MSSNQTTNYQLHSWEPGDDFLRAEFNENFRTIDTAIGEKLTIGTYVGSGVGARQITLGFKPKALLLDRATGERDQYFTAGGIALPGVPSLSGSVEINNIGFRLTGSINNENNMLFFYVAIR